MAITDDTNRVKTNIENIYDRRKAALYALSLEYAALAIQDFQREQASEAYWKNDTFQAKDGMFSDAFKTETSVGWFMAHDVDYGVYLELANDGLHQAIRPTINKFFWKFFKEARAIFGKSR